MARFICPDCEVVGETPTCVNCGSTRGQLLEPQRDSDPLRAGIDREIQDLDATPTPAQARQELPSRFQLDAKAIEDPGLAQPLSSATDRSEAFSRASRSREKENTRSTYKTNTQQSATSTNLAQFEKLLKQRFMKAVVLCGRANAGKSEIAAGYARARRIYRGESTLMHLGGHTMGRRYDVALGGTAKLDVWYQIVDSRHVFFDPSGEFFNRFSTNYRLSQELGAITENYFDFVRGAVRKLAGIVLVFDLTNADTLDSESPWREQEEVSEFTLAALRWLRMGKRPRFQDLALIDRIVLHVERLPKVDVPVLVLFSKADELATRFDYTQQHPLDFARERLPQLHAALLTHTRKFRIEFSYTMKKENGIDVPAKYPCGVLLAVEWLLGDAFRWLPLPNLSTAVLGGGK